jgi:HAD superfamily hydrolase (TIGR01509 family)
MSAHRAVLFDCDGVLVDSEPLTMQVLRDLLSARGWDMPLTECMRRFVGKATRDEAALIEARTGQPLTQQWLEDFWAERDKVLRSCLQSVPGADTVVARAHALTDGKIACVSGADRAKVTMQLEKTGLYQWFEARIFSGHEMPRNKPAPDVYLAAIHALQVQPASCFVIEDTVTGVRAGAAAGARVIGLCLSGNPVVNGADLLAAGASVVVQSLHEIPQTLSALSQEAM